MKQGLATPSSIRKGRPKPEILNLKTFTSTIPTCGPCLNKRQSGTDRGRISSNRACQGSLCLLLFAPGHFTASSLDDLHQHPGQALITNLANYFVVGHGKEEQQYGRQ